MWFLWVYGGIGTRQGGVGEVGLGAKSPVCSYEPGGDSFLPVRGEDMTGCCHKPDGRVRAGFTPAAFREFAQAH